MPFDLCQRPYTDRYRSICPLNNEENFLGCWMRDNMQDKIPGIHVGGEATALLALIL